MYKTFSLNPEDEPLDLSMLAKWGTDEDNAIRNEGSQIQSPIIDRNTKLNFEQRILNPNSYPSIDNGDGSKSTHRMAYSEVDGKFVAYPTIVQAPNGDLVPLNDQGAFTHAMNSGEFREFKTEKEAESYASGGYKKFWGLGEKK